VADVTVKRIEDFETSFGIAVIELPSGFVDYPEHDQVHDNQEEVYTVLSGRATLHVGGEQHELSPGTWARVGPRELRKISTGDEPARVLAVGGALGTAYVAPEFTEEGAPDPLGLKAQGHGHPLTLKSV
jgi:glyoxylate utilization-related uncharacterized protein